MANQLNYVKQYKDLYAPGLKPAMVQVPPMCFIMIDGAGAPEAPAYQNAVGALYALCYTIKMSKMGDEKIPGYVEYKVPPLEGLWQLGDMGLASQREKFAWTSMIRQPGFVTEEVFRWALAKAAAKKPELDFTGARLEGYDEGLCVQALHKGPYSDEPATLEKMLAFMRDNDLAEDYESGRRHHEIYLGDPRRSRPENWRTVLRLPARRL